MIRRRGNRRVLLVLDCNGRFLDGLLFLSRLQRRGGAGDWDGGNVLSGRVGFGKGVVLSLSFGEGLGGGVEERTVVVDSSVSVGELVLLKKEKEKRRISGLKDAMNCWFASTHRVGRLRILYHLLLHDRLLLLPLA